MTASNAKQLPEDEAEAVLLVLGSKLEWEDFYGEETAYTGHSRYTVLPVKGWSVNMETGKEFDTITGFKALLEEPHREEYPVVLKSEAEAKAACERHYATGRWD